MVTRGLVECAASRPQAVCVTGIHPAPKTIPNRETNSQASALEGFCRARRNGTNTRGSAAPLRHLAHGRMRGHIWHMRAGKVAWRRSRRANTPLHTATASLARWPQSTQALHQALQRSHCPPQPFYSPLRTSSDRPHTASSCRAYAPLGTAVPRGSEGGIDCTTTP